MLLYELSGILTKEPMASALSKNCTYIINGKDTIIDGTLDEDGYFYFYNLAPKPEEKTGDKPISGIQSKENDIGTLPDGPVAMGNTLTTAESAIMAQADEEEPKGAVFGRLCAKLSKTTKSSITIKWNPVDHAAGYLVYGAKCGKNKYVKLKDLPAGKKSFTLKIKQVPAKKKQKIKNHRKPSFESDNTAVATVDSKGKITAAGKGSCNIYVYAQDGIFAKVKVSVK